MSALAWTLTGWLALANLAGFLAFGLDKWKAKRGAWRIPERSLVLFAVAGGWLGAWWGLKVFRHKSSKRSFQNKLVLGTLANLALWVAAWKFGLLAEIFGSQSGAG